MLSYEIVREAQDTLIAEWGEAGKRVVNAALQVKPFNGGCGEFLNHCCACGGNWAGMYLTGVKELYPAVFDAIPNNLRGKTTDPFLMVCYVLQVCGVETDH